jgi:hypothetical protein
VFTGPIRNEHLQRVLYYAKRIRIFDHKDVDDGAYSGTPHDLIVSTYMRLDKIGAFLPLRKVHLCEPLCNTMLLPLSSPYLDTVEIRTKTTLPEFTEVGVASFLQSVASQSPLLRSLSIKGPFRSITLQVLPDFVNLQRLTMGFENSDIPPQFLRHFTSMPSLRRLHIQVANCRFTPDGIPQRPGQPHSIFRLSFPSLQTLIVGCGSIHLESLFGVLDAPLLKSAMFTLF